jgi:hypothetical protein
MLGKAVASSLVSMILSRGLYRIIWGRPGVDRLGAAATEDETKYVLRAETVLS